MVIDDTTRNRAQVILIGAIVIAFVVLGVVVVFNGLLYTEEVSTSETSHSTTHVEVRGYEIEQGIQAIAMHDLDEAGGWEGIIEEGEDFDQLLRNETEWKEVVADHEAVNRNVSIEQYHGFDTVDEDSINESASIEAGFDIGKNHGGPVLNSPGRIFHLIIETDDMGLDGEIVLEESNGNETIIEIEGSSPPEHKIRAAANGDSVEGEKTCEADWINLVSGERENPEPGCDDEIGVINSSVEYESIEYVRHGGVSNYEYDIIAYGDVEDNDPDYNVPAYLNLTYDYRSVDTTVEKSVDIDLYGDSL